MCAFAFVVTSVLRGSVPDVVIYIMSGIHLFK